MVVEKFIETKTLRRTIYVLGALLEVLGFALLFANQQTVEFISGNILVALTIIISGYVIAVGARRVK